MELQKQVCSLELSKRLKELGVKQESYFGWLKDRLGRYEISHWPVGKEAKEIKSDDYFSAFTVAELGEMLPVVCESGKSVEGTVAYKKGKWVCVFVDDRNAVDFSEYKEYADTEADARAKMLIYLIENNLLTVSETPNT